MQSIDPVFKTKFFQSYDVCHEALLSFNDKTMVPLIFAINNNEDDHGDDKADYYDDNLDVSDDRLQQRSQTATCKVHATPASAQRSQAATAAID